MSKPPQINDINAVRTALFETLRGLSDKNNPMEIERAKAICEVSQAIVNTAKVEIDFARVTGLRLESGFIPVTEITKTNPAGLSGQSAISLLREKGILEELPDGVSSPRPGVIVHKMK